MIEKLNLEEVNNPGEATLKAFSILNQLVDAVNNQQIQLNNHECRLLDLQNQINEHDQEIDDCAATISKMEKVETRAENVQNKFAEQRKCEIPVDSYAKQRQWIGCLVEYGNADDGFRYGILTNIEPRYSAYPFEIDNGRDATADCWLPSKTIFYKGGDND